MTAIVALADADVCNMALSHLGLSTFITSINPPDPGSTAAKVCAFWYAKSRNFVLQSAPWNFAYTYIALASDGSQIPNQVSSPVTGTPWAFPGWRFAYQMPNDCLEPIAVVTAAGLRFGQMYWNGYWWPYPTQMFAMPKIPFKLIQSTANPGQMAIACDVNAATQPLYLFYIQCVTNSALFDPMFAEAFSYELASKVGGPLRADGQRVSAAAQMAVSKRAEALAQHLNAAQQDRERSSPSILTR